MIKVVIVRQCDACVPVFYFCLFIVGKAYCVADCEYSFFFYYYYSYPFLKEVFDFLQHSGSNALVFSCEVPTKEQLRVLHSIWGIILAAVEEKKKGLTWVNTTKKKQKSRSYLWAVYVYSCVVFTVHIWYVWLHCCIFILFCIKHILNLTVLDGKQKYDPFEMLLLFY